MSGPAQKRAAYFLVTALTGILTGLIVPLSSTGSRIGSSHWASTEPANELRDEKNLLAYRRWPCPDEAEFRELSGRVRFSDDLTGQSCDSGPRGRIARVLKWLADLKVDPKRVPVFGKALSRSLLNPLGELAAVNKAIVAEATNRVGTIAQNRQGTLILGGEFFKEGPLFAALVLMHESRHSVRGAAGHVTCRQGDQSGIRGACDQNFRLDDKRGAFSEHSFLALAWAEAAEGLAEADREYLKTLALWTLTARHNWVAPHFAAPFDRLRILDTAGRVHDVDPWTGDLLPVIGLPERRWQRIETLRGDAIHFDDEGRAVVQDENGSESFFTAYRLQDRAVRDAGTLIDAEKGLREAYYIDPKGDLRLLERVKGKTSTFKDRPADCVGRSLTRLLPANRARMALNESGEILLCDGNGEFLPFPSLPAFRDVFPGYFENEVFAVTTAGRLGMVRDRKFMESRFPYEGSLKKYRESPNMRVALTEDGELRLLAWPGRPWSGRYRAPGSHPIADFALIPVYEPADLLEGRPPVETFSADCELRQTLRIAVTKETLGLDSEGRLVRLNKGRCEVLDLARRKLDNRDFEGLNYVGENGSGDRYSNPRGALRLSRKGGDTLNLVPYFFGP